MTNTAVQIYFDRKQCRYFDLAYFEAATDLIAADTIGGR